MKARIQLFNFLSKPNATDSFLVLHYRKWVPATRLEMFDIIRHIEKRISEEGK